LIAADENALHVFDWHEAGRPGFGRPAHGWERGCQVFGEETFGMQISQEHSQARAHDPSGRRPAVTGMPLDVARHLLARNTRNIDAGYDAQLREERTKKPKVARDRHRREATLALHIESVGLKDFFARIVQRRRSRRNGVGLPTRKQISARCKLNAVDIRSGTSGGLSQAAFHGRLHPASRHHPAAIVKSGGRWPART
jgi:hypothetical protein